MSSTATIYLVRHAQGFHNLKREPGGPDPHMISDPSLTPLGEKQCAELCRAFTFQHKVTHLVASPLRRTLYTCLLSCVPPVEAGKRVTALPEIQEISSLPCDTGSSAEALADEFGDRVDLGLVKEGWNKKGADGPWAPQMGKLEARAKAARLWLRSLAAEAGGETHIVVVTHGGFLHFLTQDWDGMNPQTGTGWANTEYRSYKFDDPSGQDPDAKLRETESSWRRRRGSTTGLTETEQMELREAVNGHLESEFEGLEEARKAREEAVD